jgi:hypothetical protein
MSMKEFMIKFTTDQLLRRKITTIRTLRRIKLIIREKLRTLKRKRAKLLLDKSSISNKKRRCKISSGIRKNKALLRSIKSLSQRITSSLKISSRRGTVFKKSLMEKVQEETSMEVNLKIIRIKYGQRRVNLKIKERSRNLKLEEGKRSLKTL